VAELEHALEAADVEHVERQGQRAGLLEARRAEAPHEAEQRVHAAHARPRQGAVEEHGCVPRDVRAVCSGLGPERLDIAQGVHAALGRIVLRVDGAAAGRLPRMRFH
jgi:hypothetical protein